LDSVAALDYPNFEAVVVINNTPEEFYWKPVEAHCAKLGPRFKFVNVLGLKGFKAGALNLALEHTASEAQVIAVIDADYVVHKDWLKNLAPAFEDPLVGLVQAPQDHRDGHRSMLKTVMNSEYAGFFDIGMIQRNEKDAIVQHGTMCMIRREALAAAGGWSSDTIVEDTELGLRLYEAGYKALYTNRRYGWGVLPDTFKAFKTQRERWAYGAVQIIRKHWRHMLPSARTLRPEQKSQFVGGWAYWLSDALGALASILNLLWVPAVLFVGVLIPTVALTVPIITAFVVNVVHCALLYRTRVKAPAHQIAGAALAAMSLQLTVAGAVMNGLIRDNLPFKRTDKGGNAQRKADENPVKWERWLGGGLLLASIALWAFNEYNVTEINLFALTIFIQSLPFLAAWAMAGLETWETRRVPAPMTGPAPAPQDPKPIYPLAAE
jgi:cellulose synthase/poly-beta-1,6-N-acetylglucosamine synthase-like glycosyltransferase